MTEDERRHAESAMAALPVEIGMLRSRRLVPVMRALPGQPNLLTAEAVAAAMVLGGEIVVTTDPPLLAQVVAAAGISVDVVSLWWLGLAGPG